MILNFDLLSDRHAVIPAFRTRVAEAAGRPAD
jgi:hypothetical protein